jgi:hypothetical protein
MNANPPKPPITSTRSSFFTGTTARYIAESKAPIVVDMRIYQDTHSSLASSRRTEMDVAQICTIIPAWSNRHKRFGSLFPESSIEWHNADIKKQIKLKPKAKIAV